MRTFLTSSFLFALLAAAAPAQGRFEPAAWSDTDAPVEQCIAFALYTTHAGTLKLTAQLYPLADDVPRTVELALRPRGVDGARWGKVAEVQVDETLYGWPQEDVKRWLAHFRVEGLDPTRDYDYRVVAAGGKATYEGLVRKDPVDEDVIVVVLFLENGLMRQDCLM